MQLKTLQIVWHGKEPVLSVDFQPNSHTLVSGGQDGEVKGPRPRMVAPPVPPLVASGANALLSGGIENNCILWDVDGRKSLKWLQDHGHYVQGVAWDPLGRYIATQSADRTARVYSVKPPPQSAAAAAGGSLCRSGAGRVAVKRCAVRGMGGSWRTGGSHCSLSSQQYCLWHTKTKLPGTAKQPLFSDDSLPTFFRRLAWSPDGAFLAAPAGVYRGVKNVLKSFLAQPN
ncbi:hypothetical protein VOLCADRAFT_89466 [Volvox carteri f. nagariensis]|uniref:Uncharacterized protein n=1 Tax=Volvox carteri f. nagariensis TaxID=3068 RepID=D8TRW9_VOLCA|nr:uncharacterized protein VOLCADRAFT_89466 [Volvox carteri f. nagariensis]EFJ49719.1 hypothetical protein VOLCADRAFT_89466 [Volvox carteri f. nagariensis]|eukprot:XP_002949226.1 hypothetical protein VOLCADRAFT_89466 [Volvox carteri f. nagariensis]